MKKQRKTRTKTETHEVLVPTKEDIDNYIAQFLRQSQAEVLDVALEVEGQEVDDEPIDQRLEQLAEALEAGKVP